MPTPTDRTRFVDIDDREPSSVRALIFARTSDPGADPEEVESQIRQCKEFIDDMHWTIIHPDNLFAYVETKSGVKRVRRPMLKQVLRMAIKGEVDVLVCTRLARIDRKEGKRLQALETARDYGADFRFVRYADNRGKLPEGVEAKLRQFAEDFYDETEAREIAARLSPGKMARYRDGLAHGGRAGPLYGYKPGERKYRHNKPMGLLTWEKDDANGGEKVRWVHWLFDTADQTPLEDLTLRGLAHRLHILGAPTATGTGTWSVKQVYCLLTNPKYCGLGRNLRYETEDVSFKDGEGEVYVTVQTHLRDPDQTWAIPETAIPRIIDPEQFERVQNKLADLRKQNNKGGPRRIDEAAHSSKFDKLVFCDYCGNKMTRYWQTRSTKPYYGCGKKSGTPDADCKSHNIQAEKADTQAIHLLADLLADPERLLDIADAAAEEADTDAKLTGSELAANNAWLRKIDAERTKYDAVLKAMQAIPRSKD
jgi:DNA invertase Pin-like site-specific DNA recombinase